MNRNFDRIQKYKGLYTILNSYPAAFEGKPEAQAMLGAFGDLVAELESKITTVVLPIAPVFSQKQELKSELMTSFRRMSGLCVLIATRTQNTVLKTEVDEYRRSYRKISNMALFQQAQRLSDLLGNMPDQLQTVGITTANLEAFSALVASFYEVINDTSLALNTRRVNRANLSVTLSSAYKLILNQVDHFVEINKTDFPELYAGYKAFRQRTLRKKPSLPEGTAEITGSVTDATTGLTVAGASVGLVEQASLTETDADGLFVIDELSAGSYSLRCFATGYEVPVNIPVTIAEGESLEFNFTLIPVAGSNAV